MKRIVLAVASFAIICTVLATEPIQRCVPNCRFKIDCNDCFCSSDGLSYGCTKRGCPPKKVCVPGSTVKVDCNTCICNKEGTGVGICTLMACPPKS